LALISILPPEQLRLLALIFIALGVALIALVRR